MKMQALASVVLVSLAMPLSLAAPPPPEKAIGINLALRDLTVKPGDDFEEYANGTWRKTTEIPADRATTGVDFEVFQKAEKRNADLIREAGTGKAAPGTPQRMVADYYAAYMDTAGIEKRGLEGLLTSWFDERGLPVVALGGYDSYSHVQEVRRYVAQYDRPAVLLYKLVVTLDAPVQWVGKAVQYLWRRANGRGAKAEKSLLAMRGAGHFLTRGLTAFWKA